MRNASFATHVARLLCLGIAAVVGSQQLHAQVDNTPPRVMGQVSDRSLYAIPGSVHPLARAEFDRGPAAPETQLNTVHLVFSRSAEQQAALDQLLAEQTDKSSPNYHRWLTPEEFGRRFGPAESDIAAVVAWLESHGLKVDPVLPGRVDVTFSGTAGQIAEALHTSIHQYERGGEAFYANSTPAQIPAAFRTLISGVAHLNTMGPRPAHQIFQQGVTGDPETKKIAAPESADRPRPDMNLGSTTLYIVAQDAATMYNTPNAFNANFGSGTAYDGTGVKIGIAGRAVVKASTVVNYRKRFVGDSTAPNIVNIDANSTADEVEAYLDMDVSGGLAPGATLYYYTSQDLFNAISQAVTANTVDILSVSYGACELNIGSGNTLISQIAAQAASQGIVVTVSTGDSGSAGCDNQNTQTTATQGLQINGLASTPYNIAVGGTDTIGLLSNPSQYESSTNRTLYGSALSYIPEAPWNNSVVQNGALDQNSASLDSKSQSNIWGGGGGKSSCATLNTDNTCKAGYAKPSWQHGPGVIADGVRDIPDVSLMAGSGYDLAAWIICTDDTFTSGTSTFTQDCSTQSNNKFYMGAAGGTSAATPAFAGILALVEQKAGSRLGIDALKTLYDLQAGSHAAAVFHDIKVGNISVPCTAGSQDCKANTAGNNFMTGYDAAAGYDLATGLGSVDATQLINFWTASVGSATPTVQLSPSATQVATNQSLQIGVTVSGGSGTPTGTVTLKYGTSSVTGTLDGSGSYTFTIAARTLTAGTQTFTVDYSGDTNYAGGSQTTNVTVTALTATVTVLPSSTTLNPIQSMTVKATVSGSDNTPTGTVSLSGGGYTASAQTLSSGTYTFTIPAGSLTSGTDTLTVSYSGDNLYAKATGTASVTVSGSAATMQLSASATSIFSSQSMTVKADLAGTGGTTPTGQVSLSGGGYSSGAQALVNGSYTFTIPANSLSAGSDVLTVSYGGDANYVKASGNVTVMVTAPTAAAAMVTVKPASGSVVASQALDVAVSVAGNGSLPTGSVTLTNGTYTSSATTLTAGAATITIPANSLNVGSNTLNVNYSGDALYPKASGEAAVTVTSPYTVSATTPASISKGGSGTATVSITADKTYSGTLALSCALTTSPAGATDLPTCSVTDGSSLTVTNGTASGTATVTINTTAAQASLQHAPGVPGWARTGGGAMLALMVFFGIPARRKAWRSLLGVLVLVLAAGSLSACGGGSSNNTPVTPKDPGTTSGAYVFTVTAKGAPAVNPAPTAAISVTIK